MDLRQLKYFVTVFECGNMSRAAEEIPISQPALTRSVRMLEDELGVELFQRHARGAAPTAAGERFYHHAKSILAECARAREDALQAGGKLAGHVAMGVGPLFASHMVDGIIARFCAKYELVAVSVLQAFFEDLVTQLTMGQIELALCNFPVRELPAEITAESLFEVRTSVFVGSGHALASVAAPSRDALAQARWVNVNQPHSQDVLESLFINESQIAPRISLRTNSLTLLKSVIVDYDFIGLVPEHMMAEDLANGAVVRLDLPGTPIVRKAGLMMRKDGYRRPIADVLAEEIRIACREMFA
jgi:DNA-binding transcriptional LysR family regulator